MSDHGYTILRILNVALFLSAAFWMSLSLTRRTAVIPIRTQRVGWGYVLVLFVVGYNTVDALHTHAAPSPRILWYTLAGLVANATISYRFRDNL